MSFNGKMQNTENNVPILERLDLGDESADDAPLDDLMSYFVEQIRAWQAKGMTLREIAAELKNYGCQTTAQNLSLFLRKKK